jgi:hypothetical protein
MAKTVKELELREAFRKRLERQQREVAAGERGQALDSVVRKLGLTSKQSHELVDGHPGRL